MRIAIAFAATAAAIALASPAHADPACRDSSDPACGGHSWNGPLQQTWDTPGYYGGMTGGNRLLCDPFTYECRGVATP
jgi:hypothetical protein